MNQKSPLEAYNSLKDPNLGAYFSKRKIQKHLRKTGLITRQGEIVPETEFKCRLIREQKEERMKTMLMQEVVEKSYEEERRHQQIIKQKFEEIAKLEAVVLRKEEERHRKLKMNEIFLPGLSTLSLTSLKNFVDHPHNQNSNSDKKMDNFSDQPLHQKHHKLKKSLSSSTLTSSSLKRSESVQRKSLRNQTSGRKPRKPPCVVSLFYFGRRRISSTNNADYIKVEQQINEMGSVIVFRGPVSYNTAFSFASCRKPTQPFSFTIYIDGLAYCSVSACCEFKHRVGSKVGGRRGLFRFNGVVGGQKCSCCKIASDLKNGTSNEMKQVKSDEPDSRAIIKSCESGSNVTSDCNVPNKTRLRPKSCKAKCSRKNIKNLTSSYCQTDYQHSSKVSQHTSTSEAANDDDVFDDDGDKVDGIVVDDDVEDDEDVEENDDDETIARVVNRAENSDNNEAKDANTLVITLEPKMKRGNGNEHDRVSTACSCSCRCSDEEDDYCEECTLANKTLKGVEDQRQSVDHVDHANNKHNNDKNNNNKYDNNQKNRDNATETNDANSSNHINNNNNINNKTKNNNNNNNNNYRDDDDDSYSSSSISDED